LGGVRNAEWKYVDKTGMKVNGKNGGSGYSEPLRIYTGGDEIIQRQISSR